MTLLFAYAVMFIIGPILMLVLVRAQSGRKSHLLAGTVVVALIGGAVAGQNGGFELVSLAMMWLAWVVLIAMCVLAVQSRYISNDIRKWSAAIGAMATVIPGLGLTLAIMMAG